MLIKKCIFLFLALFISVSVLKAQEEKKVNLLGEKFSSYLNLSDEQKTKIDPLITEIKSILETEKSKFEEIRKKRESGERMDRDEMMKLREQREKDISVIKSDIEKIKAELTPEQLEKFSEVELPNLEMRRRGRP